MALRRLWKNRVCSRNLTRALAPRGARKGQRWVLKRNLLRFERPSYTEMLWNAFGPPFESPLGEQREKFAEEVIEECAAFPFGDNDDYVDSTTQALMKYRQGYYVGLKDDYEDEKTTQVGGREYY